MEELKLSFSNQKRSVLMTRLYKLVIFATILFLVLDYIMGIKVDFYIYLIVIFLAIKNILLVRNGLVELSKVLGLIAFNIIIFLIASSEQFGSGMHLHFVTAGAVALAVFGYEKWKYAIFFVLFSLILDIIVFKTDISFLAWREVTNEQAQVFFIINTVLATAVSVYTILLFSKINYDSENYLVQNEKTIRDQNEELLKANSELDSFVYSASHDLRAPLSTLLGLINISQEESDDSKKQEYFELMKSRIASMDSFIIEIIDYSRNSRLEINQDTIDLKSLVKSIVKDLEFTPGREKVKIEFKLTNGIVFQSDKTRLGMIFTNIISNAIKYRDYSKDNCWLKISSEIVGSELALSIEDNGLGINKDYQNRVFDMFFRAHESSTGSGLGLYIVKETLTKLGGSIKLKSSERVGSNFSIVLPINLSNSLNN